MHNEKRTNKVEGYEHQRINTIREEQLLSCNRRKRYAREESLYYTSGGEWGGEGREEKADQMVEDWTKSFSG